jgi:hypothetical protein
MISRTSGDRPEPDHGVTPAWKRLHPSDRIDRIIRAANMQLTAKEQKRILRFSVLTPDEYSKVTPRNVVRKVALAR